MNTVDILLYSIAAVGALVIIGLLLCLIAIGRIRGIKKELQRVYGQENDIKKRVEQYIARKASDELGKAIEGYKEGLDVQSRQVVETMKAGTKAHLDSLGKFTLQQQAMITRQAEFIIGATIKKAQEDIDAYKRNQLEGIDEEVKKIVARVVPEVLGKAINMDEHEDLVWQALEKAKSEGLFVRGISARGPASRSISGPVARATQKKSELTNRQSPLRP